MGFKTVKVFDTKVGYKGVILFVNSSHHCGYVGIPKEHPLYGKDYRETIPNTLPKETLIGKRGIIPPSYTSKQRGTRYN